MKKVIKKIFWRKKRANFGSVVEALSKILDRKRLERIIIECPDRRLLLDVAANDLKISINQIALKVSQVLGLNFVEKIPLADFAYLNERLSASRFRKLGAIPVIKDQRISAIVCVDPCLLEPFKDDLVGVEIYMSTWARIVKALDESEEEYDRLQELQKKESRNSAALKVLGMLIEEVEGYQQNSVSLVFLDDQIEYRFNTAGKQGMGSISNAISDSLLDFIKIGAQKDYVALNLPTQNQSKNVTIEINDAENFEARLSWPTQKQVVKQYKFTPSSSSKIIQLHSSATNNDASVNFQGARLLLVDDNDTFASVLKRFFLRQKLEVDHQVNGLEAWNYLENCEQMPDLVVCDFHMPQMNGSDFVKKLRAQDRFNKMPVIMLTSDDSTDREVELISCGADAFVSKADDPRILCAHVEKFLSRRSKAA